MHRHNIVTKIIAIRLFIHSWAHLHVVNFLFRNRCHTVPKPATNQWIPRLRESGPAAAVAARRPSLARCSSPAQCLSTVLASQPISHTSFPLQHSAMPLHGVTRTPHLLNLKSFGYLYAEVEYTLEQGSSLESCTALRSTSSSVKDP